MMNAFDKLVTGLQEALAYAICENRHTEAHVRTSYFPPRIEGEFEIIDCECMTCHRQWEERQEPMTLFRDKVDFSPTR